MVLMPWESMNGQWRLLNSFQQENPRAMCRRESEAHYHTPKHLLVSTLIVFGIFCHCSILTHVKGPAGTDHGLGDKPRTLGRFWWELPSTEWSRGTLEEQWDAHSPPLSATQLTVNLRFKESLLHVYKSSCWWSSGTKRHDHRESFILLKGQRPVVLLQQSRYALGVQLISSSLEGWKLFWKGNKKEHESHEGPSSHVFRYFPASCWTAWPSSKLAL